MSVYTCEKSELGATRPTGRCGVCRKDAAGNVMVAAAEVDGCESAVVARGRAESAFGIPQPTSHDGAVDCQRRLFIGGVLGMMVMMMMMMRTSAILAAVLVAHERPLTLAWTWALAAQSPPHRRHA